jgi:predicted RNase H-like HicB family nuclease
MEAAVALEKEVPMLTACFWKDPQDPKYWLAQLAEEPRVHTFGRSLGEAEYQIEDAARLWYQVEPTQPMRLRRRFETRERREGVE